MMVLCSFGTIQVDAYLNVREILELGRCIEGQKRENAANAPPPILSSLLSTRIRFFLVTSPFFSNIYINITYCAQPAARNFKSRDCPAG